MKAILYVAGTNIDELTGFLADRVQGATITPGRGLWRGQWETQFTVTLYGVPHLDVEFLASLLCARYDQQAVLIEQQGEAYTVDRNGARATIGRV